MNVEHAIYILQEQEAAIATVETFLRDNDIINKLAASCTSLAGKDHLFPNRLTIIHPGFEVVGVSKNTILMAYDWYGPYQAHERYFDEIPIEILGNIELGCRIYYNCKFKQKQDLLDEEASQKKKNEDNERAAYLRLKEKYESSI